MDDFHEQRAEALRAAAYSLGDLLAEKAAAYGNAQDMQRGLWRTLLEPYRASVMDGGGYLLPPELIDHIPRLTRVFDRICRIVSNPAGDRMGEDPWRDLAGDAVAGIVMPRTCPDPGCERAAGHDGPHGYFDSRGIRRWDGDTEKLTVGGDDWLSELRADAVAGLEANLGARSIPAAPPSTPRAPGASPAVCARLHEVAGGAGTVWACILPEGHLGLCQRGSEDEA